METDTEQLIIQTAQKHFIQKGFSATRMQDIADEAGINKALLHYYFRSKEKMYQEILNRILDTLLPRLMSSLAAEGPFMVRVEHLVDTYIQTILENPHIPLFIMSELSQQKQSFIQSMKKKTADFLPLLNFIGQMKDEMDAGNIRSMPPEHLFLNILGMTVFPFMAKPIFTTMFDVSDATFTDMMHSRKVIIMDFLHHALRND